MKEPVHVVLGPYCASRGRRRARRRRGRRRDAVRLPPRRRPPTAPPNCTAADFAGVASGVSAATSAYLFTHPDVNDFFTGLRASRATSIRGQVDDYMDANPQVKAELTGIRQPLVDIKNRCG